jgi:hypothetical protein
MKELVDVMGLGRKEAVMNDTWGHLTPKPRQKYTGHILFTTGCYGDVVIIQDNFKNLPSSPWYYDHVTDFVYQNSKKFETGTVVRFDGTYMKFKNGNCRFSGKFKTVLD